MANTRENPYVGPRAFTLADKQKLFGRDRDITATYRLLIAERIVLLFSPSGAGKTSLVQAGLIPRMQEKGFDILPVIRVNQEIPEALKSQAGLNRYVLSVIQALEEDKNLPNEQHLSDEQLATQTLPAYFSRRLKLISGLAPDAAEPSESDHNLLLIFDQFEEVLTFDPNDRDGKWEFFKQVGDVLNERNYWALFVIREDYVAALDPYLRLIPSRLANTYRLDLLDFEAAQQAIRKPARLMGVEYADDAVTKLADDLRSVRVQKPDGSWEKEPQLGRYVEPVQLQVVCYRLWSQIEDTQLISAEQVEKLGNVSEALAGYYADQVLEAAQKLGVPEKEIRTWFENQLITRNGIRSQVMFAEGASGGLSNLAVLYLERTHLIRGETRRGVKWYELAHDRLIRPIRANNKDWFLANLNPFQRQALLWDEQSHDPDLLLSDAALARAEKWADSNPLTEVETQFIKACQTSRKVLKAAKTEKENQILQEHADALSKLNRELETSQAAVVKSNQALGKSVRDLRTRNIVALGLLAVAVLLGVVAFIQSALAQNNAVKAQKSEATAVAASTEAIYQQNIAVENANLAQQQKAIADTASAQANLEKNKAQEQEKIARQQEALNRASSLSSQALTLLDTNPQLAALLAIQSSKVIAENQLPEQPATLQTLRKLLGKQQGLLLSGHRSSIQSLAFSPDNQYVATAAEDDLRLWDLTTANPAENKTLLRPDSTTDSTPISTVLFSPDGAWLAAGSSVDNGDCISVFLYKKEPPNYQYRAQLTSASRKICGPVSALAFGKVNSTLWLAAATSKGAVVTWQIPTDASRGQRIETGTYLLSSGAEPITSLVFSPVNGALIAAGQDKNVRLWDVTKPSLQPAFLDQDTNSAAFAINADGTYIATGGKGEDTNIWNVSQRLSQTKDKKTTLTNIIANVTALAYGKDAKNQGFVAIGYQNGNIVLWRSSGKSYVRWKTLPKMHDEEITALTVSSDGKWLISGSKDRSVRVWNLESGQSTVYGRFLDPITKLALSNDSQWLIAGSKGGDLRLWNLRKNYEAVDPVPLPQTTNQLGLTFSFPTSTSLLGALDNHNGILSVMKWDLTQAGGGAAQSLVTPIQYDTEFKYLVSISPDGRWVSAPTTSGLVLADLADKAPAFQKLEFPALDEKTGEFLYTLAFSPDSHWLALGTSVQSYDGGRVILLDLTRTPKTYQEFKLPATPYTFSFNPARQILAAGTSSTSQSGGKIFLWDLNQAAPAQIEVEVAHDGWVNALALSSDGHWLASGDDAGATRLIDISNLQKISSVGTLKTHTDWVTTVAFSSDGQWLAAGSNDTTVHLWSLPLPAEPEKDFIHLQGHEGPVWLLFFSNDAHWLLSVGNESDLFLWDLAYLQPDLSGNRPRTLPPIKLSGHTHGAFSVALSEDGLRLVSSDYDETTQESTTLLWSFDLKSMQEKSCTVAGRDISKAEWEQYMPNQPFVPICPATP